MKSRKSVVHAFVSASTAMDTAIADLVADMKGTTYISYRNAAAQIIGALPKYAVEPHKSQTKGWLTFEKDSPAEQCLSRLMKHHPKQPKSGNKTAPTFTRAQKKAVKDVLELFEGETLKAQVNQLRALLSTMV